MALIAFILCGGLEVRGRADGADCAYLQRAVSALTERYRAQKSEYEQLTVALKKGHEQLDEARQAQTRYFLEHQATSRELDLKLQYIMYAVKVREKEKSRLHDEALDTYRQLQAKKAELSQCKAGAVRETPTPKPVTEDWTGTYVDSSGHKLEIASSGATFTAESTWTASETQGGTNTLHCTANGSTAACTGAGSYFDTDKTITTTTNTTLRKSGSTIRETDRVLTAACTPKKEGVTSCKDLGYTPAVHAGAKFTINVRKP